MKITRPNPMTVPLPGGSPGGTAGGDLGGTYPSPTVEQINGLPPSWKNPVRVSTTTAGTLATDFEEGDTIDGVVLAIGDRILIKDQAAGAENGIYTVNSDGVPTRAVDMDEADEVVGAVVYVKEGTTNAGTIWVNTNLAEPTLETTAITFEQFIGDPGGLLSVTDGVTTVAPTTSITTPLGGVVDSGGGNANLEFLTPNRGGQHGVVVDESVSGTYAFDLSQGNWFYLVLTGNVTSSTVSNPPPDGGSEWHIILIQGGSGSYTFVFPTSFDWRNPSTGANDGSAPTLKTAVGAQDNIEVAGIDGGTSWGARDENAGGTPGGAAGGDLSGTYPNPSVVDDSHSHTSTASPTTHWEPVQFDDGSAEWPFVFFNGELVMAEVPN